MGWDGWIDEWTDGWVDGWISRCDRASDDLWASAGSEVGGQDCLAGIPSLFNEPLNVSHMYSPSSNSHTIDGSNTQRIRESSSKIGIEADRT